MAGGRATAPLFGAWHRALRGFRPSGRATPAAPIPCRIEPTKINPMTTKQQIAEAFLKAHESAQFLRSNLLEANAPTATEEPYLHHILLDLLDRVSGLQGELQHLRHLTQAAADNDR